MHSGGSPIVNYDRLRGRSRNINQTGFFSILRLREYAFEIVGLQCGSERISPDRRESLEISDGS